MGLSITIDVLAKIVGYEASIKLLETALSKIDPGSDMGKKISKALQGARDQLTDLGKNMFPKASTDALVDAIVDKVNRIGDAILSVSGMFSNLNILDLNLGALGNELTSFLTKVNSLSSELDSKINLGLVNAVANSSELSHIFSLLGTDMSKATADSLFSDLEKGAKAASDEVKNALNEYDSLTEKINKKLASLNKLESSPFGDAVSAANIHLTVDSISKLYDLIWNSLRDRMAQGLLEKLAGNDKLNPDQFLNLFFNGITPENIKDKILELFSLLQTASVYAKSGDTRNFYSDIFGELARDIHSLVKALNIDGLVAEVKNRLSETILKIGGDLKLTDKLGLDDLIAGNHIGEACNRLVSTVDKALNETLRKIKDTKAKLEELHNALVTAENRVGNATRSSTLMNEARSKMELEYLAVLKENEENKKLLEEYRALLLATLLGELRNTLKSASNAGINAGGYKFPLEEANQYKDAIDLILSRELMLGKVQGVVQRWFSVYAAVRMVSKAFKKITSDVKELDSTITEIAIVTNKTLPELWDLMPQYTKLAREYAASISGVYKVSQLYYQQGLGLSDVMSLTELTLKMARISGLDYAQATDYMTNAIRSFKLEMTDALTVVDTYSAVAAKSATSVTELATAMSKTASSALSVGSSMQNTTAMMAVMIEATRESPENIGSAMKSIISRYGELKENKTGIDEEGEEYSLNKVDKALLSVGISIHDTNGEFRDFDDVIFELADHWNEIDKNTQRYIATVMAGNRQQSRFLALVSSGERLKQLSAEATDSEDASQLLFLKTLDSVDAKTQQLLTSIQSLYVNSGFEDAYKGVLDYTNLILKSFDSLSLNNGFLTAATKIGASFGTVATIVTNAFSMIKTRYANMRAEMVAESKVANEKMIQDELERLTVTTDAEYERQLAAILLSQERQASYQREADSARGAKAAPKNTKVGMTVAALGMAATTVGGMIDVNENRKLKAGLTGAGGVLSGIGMGTMIGGPAGILMGFVSALPSLIESLSMWDESLTEKIERYDSNIEESSNERIKAKDELKTLTEYEEKYKELSRTKDLNAESKAEWLKLNAEIVDNYPQLLSYIDEEGNSIASLGANYDKLVQLKRDAYELSMLDDIKNHLEAYSDMNYVLNDLITKTSLTVTSKKSFWSWESGDEKQAEVVESFLLDFSPLLSLAQGDKNLLYDLFELKYGVKYSDLANLEGNYTFTGVRKDLVNSTLFGDSLELSDDLSNSLRSALQVIDSNFDYYTNMASDYMDRETAELASYYGLKDELDYINYGLLSDQASKYLDSEWKTELANAEKNRLPIGTAVQKFMEKVPTLLNKFNQELINNGTFLNESTLKEATDIFANTKKYSKNYIDSVRNSTSKISQLITTELWEEIDETIEKETTKMLNYYHSFMEKASETGKISAEDFSFFSGNADNFSQVLFETLKDVPLDYWESYLGQIETIVNSSNFSSITKRLAVELFTGLRNRIIKDLNLTSTLISALDAAMSLTDFSSVTDILKLLTLLKDIGINADFNSLVDIIIPNINAEMSTLASDAATQLSAFDKALSNASKGMGIEDAVKMAETLDTTLADEDFVFKDGKYFYNNIEKLRLVYLLNAKDSLNVLKDKIDDLITTAGTKMTPDEGSRRILDMIGDLGDSSVFQENPADYIMKAYAADIDTAEQLENLYNQYYSSFKKLSKITSFADYVISLLQASSMNLDNIMTEAADYSANKFLLDTGHIEEFVKSTGAKAEDFMDLAESNVLSKIKSAAEFLSESEQEFLDKGMAKESEVRKVAEERAELAMQTLSDSATKTPEQYREDARRDILRENGFDTLDFDAMAEETLSKSAIYVGDLLLAAKDLFISETYGPSTKTESLIEAIAKAQLKNKGITPETSDPEGYATALANRISELKKTYDVVSDEIFTSEDFDLAAWEEEVLKEYEGVYDDSTRKSVAESIKSKTKSKILTENAKEVEERAIKAMEERRALMDPETYYSQALDELSTTNETFTDDDVWKLALEKALQAKEELILEEALRLADEMNAATAEAIASGDMSYFSGDLALFAAAARKAYTSTWQSINTSMTTALGGGDTFLEITSANKLALVKLSQLHPELFKYGQAGATWDEKGEYITALTEGGLLEWNVQNLRAMTELLAADIVNSLLISNKEKTLMMQDWRNAKYNNNLDTISNFITDTDTVTFDALSNYLTSMSETGEAVTEITDEVKLKYGLTDNGFGGFTIADYDQYIAGLKSDLAAMKGLEDTNAYKDVLIKIDAAERTKKNKEFTKLTKAFEDAIKNYSNISDDQITALQDSLGDNWEIIEDYMTPTGTGTYKLDIGRLKSDLDKLGLVPEMLELILGMFSNVTDDYLKNITTATSLMTQGTSNQADILKFIKSARQIGIDASNAFNFDSILGAWTLDPLVLNAYVKLQAQQLVNDGLLNQSEVEDFVLKNVKESIASQVDIDSFLKAENRKEGSQAREKLTKLLKDLYISRMPEHISDEAKLAYINAADLTVENQIKMFEAGGEEAVKKAQEIADLAGKELTLDQIDSYYYSQTTRIKEFADKVADLTTGSYVADGEFKDILTEVGMIDTNGLVLNIGNMAQAYKKIYDKMGKAGEATAASLNEIYAKYLTEAERGDIDAIEAMGNAMGMTYDALGQILGREGTSLESWLATNKDIYENIGAGKIRITDFTKFAALRGWEPGSEEYTSAFKTYNDGLIDLNKKAKEQIKDEVKQLEEARPGDWLNLTLFEKAFKKISKKNTKDRLSEAARFGKNASRVAELNKLLALGGEKFISLLELLVKAGAYLEDGILKLTDEANLLKVADVLSSAAMEVGGDIGAEMADMVLTITSSYTEAITKGITGNITNADRTNLILKARNLGLELSNMDFIQTAEGLNLSLEAAISLYTAISETDALQGNLTFKTLSDSLKENNKNYKTATDLLAHIGELERNINGLKDALNDKDVKRKKQLQEELALAKEIAMQSFTHEEGSWDFLSADALPFDVDNAITYWEDWARSLSLMKDWKKNGYADLDQFSAMLLHVEQISKATGESIEFMGTAVGGATGVTYDEYLDKLSDVLTYNEKLGKMVLDKNKLRTELGFDLGLGDKGYTLNLEDNINKYVNDIATLAEALNDTYSGLNSIYESFHDTSDGNKTSFEDFLDPTGDFDYSSFRTLLSKKKGALEAFDKFTDLVKINGENWKDVVKDNSKIKKDTAEYDAMSSIIGMAMSEDWDLDSDYAAIAELMAKTKFTGEFEIGEMKIVAKKGKTVIETKDEDGNAKYYTEDGEYTTAEAAWASIYLKQLDELGKKFGKSLSEVSGGEFSYTLDGETYTIKIDGDHFIIEKGDKSTINGEGGQPEEYGSTEEAFAAIRKDYIDKNKKEIDKNLLKQLELMSNEGFMDWASKTNKEGNYDWTKNRSKTNYDGITSEARSKITLNNWNAADLTEIATKLKDLGLTGGAFASQFGVETGIYLDENTVSEFVTAVGDTAEGAGQAFLNKMQHYVDESFDLSQAASDVRDGITAAFGEGSQALTNITTAILDGITGGKDGKIPVDIVAEANVDDALSKINAIKRDGNVIVPVVESGVDAVKAAINSITGKTVTINVVSNGTTGITKPGMTTTPTGPNISVPVAKGTVGLAHAKSTLMGELGPEMVVSNGRYFVVGQNGPEFVDLADDAIVFNHLQTQSLLTKGMSSTRGRAVTNELNAVAYAHGNLNGGPAHPNNNNGNVGLKTRDTAGGGSIIKNGANIISNTAVGAAVEEISEAFIKTLDIWYNYLQEIAKLEKQLSYEETLRSKLSSDFNKDGQAYYDSQTRSWQQMTKKIAVDQELINKLTEYQLQRYQEMVSAGNPFTAFYELDSEGQLRYKEGAEDRFNAIFSASKLTNAPYETLLEQYNWLINNGFDAYMEYDKEGKKIEVGGENDKNGSGMKSAIQAFVDKMETDRDEFLSIYDNISDTKNDILEQLLALNELLKEMEDNLIAVEEKVYDAIVDTRERAITELKDQKDAIQESNTRLINGLTKLLNKEREMYETNLSEDELARLQRLLGILLRSGGSAAEINELLALIDDKTKDLYFTKQLEQIDAILDASDVLIEKLEELIELEEEALEYLKNNGLLWEDVHRIMTEEDPQSIAAFITEHDSKYWGESPLQLILDTRDTLFEALKYIALRDDTSGILSNTSAILNALNKESEDKGNELSGTWKQDETGWWYEHDDGSYTKNDWEKIDDKWYYFNDKGYMHTGWHHEGNDWYYLRDQGDMHTGWHQEGNQWYYFGSDGKMVTGALTIDGVDYNFGDNGALASSGTGSGAKSSKTIVDYNGSTPVATYNISDGKLLNTDSNISSISGETEPWKRYKDKITGKARGGYVNHGIYELGEQGTETVLTAHLTEVLRNDILGNSHNSLMSLLMSFRDAYDGIGTNSYIDNTNNQVTIEHAEVKVMVDHLNNNYDAARAGDDIMKEMVNIARKTSINNRIWR